MQFDDIIEKYRSEAYSERDKDTGFEELMAKYFMTDPTYSSMLEWTRTWMDFSGRKDLGGRDTGIDLVAKTKSGEYWAIQCKCYAEDHRVSKADMDTFISTSGRKFHDEDKKKSHSRYVWQCTGWFGYLQIIETFLSKGINIDR